jgi:hypothetical protein
MTQVRIHSLVSVGGLILLVYHCDTWEWQFRIISGSAVFGEQKLYYSAEAAQKAGREWIAVGS